MKLSNKFANLPNGIIREIIEYTGAKYKKRNGKYMGQIPKNDRRFAILLKMPKKHIEIFITNEYAYFNSRVVLFVDNRNDIYTIELHVIGIIYKNKQNSLCTSHFIIDDGNNNRREYRYSEELIEIEKRMKNIKKWMVIVDRLWWVSFGYLVINVINMVRRYKSSQK